MTSRISAPRQAGTLAVAFLASCGGSALAERANTPAVTVHEARIGHQVVASQPAKLQIRRDFWGFEQGAPEDVLAIAQTADGFLWLGSENGLFRFDGTRFEPFRSPLGDRLLSASVFSLLAPRSGGLWVGYSLGGFSFLNNGRVTNYANPPGSPTGTVESLAEDRDGVIWGIATSGVWRFDRTRWQHLGADWNAPVAGFQIGSDARGILWVVAGKTLTAPVDLVYLLPGSHRFQTAAHTVNAWLFQDATGRVVTRPGGQGPTLSAAATFADAPADFPVLIEKKVGLIDRTGSLWAASIDPNDTTISRLEPSGTSGITKVAPDTADVYHDIDPTLRAQLIDREGNTWFGTPRGVYRFSYSRLIRPDSPEGAGRFSVAADDDGAVWIASQTTIQHNSRGVSDSIRKQDGLLEFVFAAPDKTFWLATDRGLWHFAGGRWTQVSLPPEMADQAFFLQAITADRTGGMWVSFGRHGLYRLANGVWTPYGGRADIPRAATLIEFTDSAGRIWFGYLNNQVAVLDGDRVQVFGASEGIRTGAITAISGRGREVWIGGEFGLQLFDHGRFRDISAVDDEWLRGISGVVETANGDLWIYGHTGIFHVRRAEIAEALRDPGHRVHGRHIGRQQGAPGIPDQLQPLPSAIEGSDGRLWFSSASGVAWLDPTLPEDSVPAPSITVESVSADDKYYPLDQPLQFPAHTSVVQLSYAAASLANPEAIRYRYKLEETDKTWHEARAASPVTYRNLSPGSYHFSVSATDTDGAWSGKVATAAFTILPAFYQTPWFVACCTAAGLGTLYLIYRLRMRHLAREFNLTLEARVSERERIARELHDTLLQSFHGLLLQLQTAYKLLPARPDKAKQTLEIAIDGAFEAATEGRDTVQSLRASTVAGNDLAAAIKTLGEELAGQQSEQSPVLRRVDVTGTPQALRPLVRDEIYRIAGESLRNAFHHAAAKRIEVELCYDEVGLRLRVRDDGKGIHPRFLEDEAPSGHYGIHGMRERAKLIGGSLSVWTAPDSGTEVELCVPASLAYAASTPVQRRWSVRKLFGGRTPVES